MFSIADVQAPDYDDRRRRGATTHLKGVSVVRVHKAASKLRLLFPIGAVTTTYDLQPRI
jgi:hypothetical protein